MRIRKRKIKSRISKWVFFTKKHLCMHSVSIVYVLLMTLKPLAVRVPSEVEQEISEIVEKEKVDKATVVRNLLEIGLAEWRKQTALDLMQKGKITFAKAAEVAKLSLWEFADLVKQRNVEWVRLAPEEVEKEFREASAAKHK